jgi:uncharacterized membrane protein
VTFEEAIGWVGQGIEAAGVGVIVVGLVAASMGYFRDVRAGGVTAMGTYRRYRQGLGRAILLGLEFLVAGDIIRTVTTSPSFQAVGVLAAIVLIRTFLSIALEVETEGRWPWQNRDAAEQAPPS